MLTHLYKYRLISWRCSDAMPLKGRHREHDTVRIVRSRVRSFIYRSKLSIKLKRGKRDFWLILSQCRWTIRRRSPWALTYIWMTDNSDLGTVLSLNRPIHYLPSNIFSSNSRNKDNSNIARLAGCRWRMTSGNSTGKAEYLLGDESGFMTGASLWDYWGVGCLRRSNKTGILPLVYNFRRRCGDMLLNDNRRILLLECVIFSDSHICYLSICIEVILDVVGIRRADILYVFLFIDLLCPRMFGSEGIRENDFHSIYVGLVLDTALLRFLHGVQ